ncbi:NAD(P)H-dependent oxidoreductase [Sphingomonas sp. C3-2]|uniref:NADPH-dependent FMN reductase n=1 Tax=Sphingomonas sp. C3-2 TaxID=3062169 RepID=UPI00294B6F1E|nr:NAD(P)H-dependent oxidoreductase [Sphingomonas sp. C3-2]WOK38185.1 NAD(P)H-dependent oxidoreductase [Sphingomonas sp. C3-2]
MPGPTESRRPLIVGLGGTTKQNSSSERVLRHVLQACESAGADTLMFDGPALDMPMYAPEVAERTEKAQALIAGLRRADGIVIASPGYHGTVSGLIKNALDYVQDMAADERVYFEGRAVGLIAVAAGWQATGTTLATLRSITHALRGWPTPMAVTINAVTPVFGPDGGVADAAIGAQLDILARQVVDFAQMKALHDLAQAAGDACDNHPG